MLITTTERIPGHKYEVLGEVFGVTTQSRNMVSDIGAGLKSLVGGEVREYTKMLQASREEAIERLRQEAQAKGADAVVMMRFDSGSIAGDMQSVVAYGTAVKFTDWSFSDFWQLGWKFFFLPSCFWSRTILGLNSKNIRFLLDWCRISGIVSFGLLLRTERWLIYANIWLRWHPTNS